MRHSVDFVINELVEHMNWVEPGARYGLLVEQMTEWQFPRPYFRFVK